MRIAKCFRLFVTPWLLAAGAALAAEPTPTQFARIDLLDGRTLKNVELKSYDAASGNVMLVADQKAMLVPVSLIPAPFGDRWKKDLPPPGEITMIVGTSAGANAHPSPPGTPPAAQPVVPTPPTIVVIPPPMPAAAGSAEGQPALAAHKQAAEARATRYFRFEYRAGSDAISVTALEIETDQPEAIDGWPGRYRTKGRAFLEFYDSRGRSFSRAESRFEVLTEQKPGEPMKVVDFIHK